MKTVEAWLKKLDSLIAEYPLLSIGVVIASFISGAMLMVLVAIYLLADDKAKLQAASVFLSAFATPGALIAVAITLIERRERQVQEAKEKRPNLILVSADLTQNPDGTMHAHLVFANLSTHPIYIRDAVRTSDRSRTHWTGVLAGNILLKAGESGVTYELDFSLNMFTHASLIIYFNFALTGERLHSLELPITRAVNLEPDGSFISYAGLPEFDTKNKVFSDNANDLAEMIHNYNKSFRSHQE